MAKESYFSLKQLKAIELMAQGELTQVKIGEEVGVNPKSVTRWKKDPKFMHAVMMRARSILKESLPKVYDTLAKDARTGSAQHIKIMLDHLESLEAAQTNTATISFTWKDEDDS